MFTQSVSAVLLSPGSSDISSFLVETEDIQKMAAPKDGLFVTNYHLIDRLDVTKERSEEEEESEEEDDAFGPKKKVEEEDAVTKAKKQAVEKMQDATNMVSSLFKF